MPCVYCEVRDKKRGIRKIYKDNVCFAVLHPSPSVPGHIGLAPNDHHAIIEQVPDFTIEHLFIVANRLSKILFEALPIQGTNIIVQNGVAAGQDIPHFAINIIPRTEGDGLDFQWDPKKFSDEEISTVELLLKDMASQNVAFDSQEQKKEITITNKTEELKEEDGKENYMMKHINRIP